MSQVQLSKILRKAEWIASDPTDCRDLRTGELNLTLVEEEVQNHFDISDDEWNSRDLSYEIWKRLNERAMIGDN